MQTPHKGDGIGMSFSMRAIRCGGERRDGRAAERENRSMPHYMLAANSRERDARQSMTRRGSAGHLGERISAC
jgi:hypothetical protein